VEAANFSESTRNRNVGGKTGRVPINSIHVRTRVPAVRRSYPDILARILRDKNVSLIVSPFLQLRALPAFTIHTAVKYAKPLFTNVRNPRLKLWGPTITGLSLVPGLPFVFDHPVERATDVVFEWVEKQMIERNATEKASRDKPS
jgi:hypothetical protein